MRKVAVMLAALFVLTTAVSPAFAQEATSVPPTKGGASQPGEPGTEPADPGRPADQAVAEESMRVLVDGKEVSVIPAGGSATLEIGFHNYGSETATGVVVAVKETHGGRAATDRADLGTIASGASKKATFEIIAFDGAPGTAQACTDFLFMVGEVHSSLGNSAWKGGTSVACPGPRINLDRIVITGGDGDQTFEPGETLSMLVTVRNDGRDPATNVKGTMTVVTGEVTLVSDDGTWPDIAPGKTATARIPFVVKVADDAKTQKSCGGWAGPGNTEPGTVKPDETVTSDGSTGGGSSSSSGGSTPETTLIAPAPPTRTEPAPSGNASDLPATSTLPPVAEGSDYYVPMELTIKGTASGIAWEMPYAAGSVCMAEGRGAPSGTGTYQAVDAKAAAEGARVASHGQAPLRPAWPIAIAGACIAAGLGARILRNRKAQA